MASPREEVAESLADTCIFGNLNDSYGVTKGRGSSAGKSFWLVTFAVGGTLDGIIRVYSPAFIQIKWEGSRARVSGLPFGGSEIFRSVEAARTFLVNHFVNV